MKLSRVLIYAAVAILVVGAVGAGIATGHKKKFKTTVTIAWNDTPSGDTFDGDVRSKTKKCSKKRRVKVFRVQGNQLIGSDTTFDHGKESGHYEVHVGGEASPGDYFAKVKKKVLKKNANHKHICKKATSAPVTVP